MLMQLPLLFSLSAFHYLFCCPTLELLCMNYLHKYWSKSSVLTLEQKYSCDYMHLLPTRDFIPEVRLCTTCLLFWHSQTLHGILSSWISGFIIIIIIASFTRSFEIVQNVVELYQEVKYRTLAQVILYYKVHIT